MSEQENIWEGAACAETTTVAGFHLQIHDPDLWFEAYFENQAKAVCASCSIRQKCLEYAITNKETEGIWGGLSGPERLKLTNKGK
jgi:hypothetical protein